MPGNLPFTIIINGKEYVIYWWSNEKDTNPYKPIHVHLTKEEYGKTKENPKIYILSDNNVCLDEKFDFNQLNKNFKKDLRKDIKQILIEISNFSDQIKELWIKDFKTIQYYDQQNN